MHTPSPLEPRGSPAPVASGLAHVVADEPRATTQAQPAVDQGGSFDPTGNAPPCVRSAAASPQR